jgi:hypothetical protein
MIADVFDQPVNSLHLTVSKLIDRRLLACFLFACTLIGFEVYLGFFRHAEILRTEGEKPFPVYQFGVGATVTHAFRLQSDSFQAVSIRLVADRPSSLRMVCKLLRLDDRDVGAEDNPNVFTEIYRWTDTVGIPAGERWQRVEFPSVANRMVNGTGLKSAYSMRPHFHLAGSLRAHGRPSESSHPRTILRMGASCGSMAYDNRVRSSSRRTAARRTSSFVCASHSYRWSSAAQRFKRRSCSCITDSS